MPLLEPGATPYEPLYSVHDQQGLEDRGFRMLSGRHQHRVTKKEKFYAKVLLWALDLGILGGMESYLIGEYRAPNARIVLELLGRYRNDLIPPNATRQFRTSLWSLGAIPPTERYMPMIPPPDEMTRGQIQNKVFAFRDVWYLELDMIARFGLEFLSYDDYADNVDDEDDEEEDDDEEEVVEAAEDVALAGGPEDAAIAAPEDDINPPSLDGPVGAPEDLVMPPLPPALEEAPVAQVVPPAVGVGVAAAQGNVPVPAVSHQHAQAADIARETSRWQQRQQQPHGSRSRRAQQPTSYAEI